MFTPNYLKNVKHFNKINFHFSIIKVQVHILNSGIVCDACNIRSRAPNLELDLVVASKEYPTMSLCMVY